MFSCAFFVWEVRFLRLYETAVVRPSPLRSIVYRMKRELLDAKIKKAETDEERARLIEERNQLDRDLSGMIETR